MIGRVHVAAAGLVALAVFVSAVPAGAKRVAGPFVANAMFEATLTYTEDAAVRIKTADKPQDKDDTDFAVRINATFKRPVQMTHDEEGMSVHECMEWNPDGGCKTYTPLTFGGSVTYHIEHTMHTENLPKDLPDVYTAHSVADFAGTLQPDSAAGTSEVNLAALEFDLAAGMKGNCLGTTERTWATIDNSTNQPRQVSHHDSSEVKKCSEDWGHAAYEPNDVSGVKADGSDAPEMRQIRIHAYSCTNINSEACVRDTAAGEAGAMSTAIGNDWYDGVASGNMQQGYKFHLEQVRDVGKYMLKDAGGTWKRNMIIDAKVIPTAKTGKGAVAANVNPRDDMNRLATRKRLMA